MLITPGGQYALERVPGNETGANSILVELTVNGNANDHTTSDCAVFRVLVPKKPGSTQEWKEWDEARLKEAEEEEIGRFLRQELEASFADVNRLMAKRSDPQFEMHVGRIMFPRQGLFIPKWVQLTDTHRIAITSFEKYEADRAAEPSSVNYLVLHQLKLRSGIVELIKRDYSNEDLELISRTFVGFEFEALRDGEWVKDSTLDKSLSPCLADIQEKFMKVFFSVAEDYPAFDFGAYCVGCYYCVKTVAFHFEDKVIEIDPPKFPI